MTALPQMRGSVDSIRSLTPATSLSQRILIISLPITCITSKKNNRAGKNGQNPLASYLNLNDMESIIR